MIADDGTIAALAVLARINNTDGYRINGHRPFTTFTAKPDCRFHDWARRRSTH